MSTLFLRFPKKIVAGNLERSPVGESRKAIISQKVNGQAKALYSKLSSKTQPGQSLAK